MVKTLTKALDFFPAEHPLMMQVKAKRAQVYLDLGQKKEALADAQQGFRTFVSVCFLNVRLCHFFLAWNVSAEHQFGGVFGSETQEREGPSSREALRPNDGAHSRKVQTNHGPNQVPHIHTNNLFLSFGSQQLLLTFSH
jgi:hypothetical protein